MSDNYLIIVRYDSDSDTWLVDEDSRYILEEGDSETTVQELRVSGIRHLS